MSNPSEPLTASRTFTNPAYSEYFADPFVFRHQGVYYALGTGESSDPYGGIREFPMLRSEDFLTWHPVGYALKRPEIGATHFWAPEVAVEGGRFYLYYSAGIGDRGHHLRVATSDRPEGPYVDTGAPLLNPECTPFAIDASPFRDDDGRWYLFYARDFLDTDRPGTALVVAPLDDMTRLGTDFHVVMRARHDWQRYQANRSMYGGVYDWHTLEGPCVVKHEGRYYCLYSGGNWQNATYGLDFVVADSVLGPYIDTNEGEGARVLRTVPGKVIGPGHNSIVEGPYGRQMYVAYHAWDIGMEARRICFDRLEWTPTGPRCLGPTWEPQLLGDDPPG